MEYSIDYSFIKIEFSESEKSKIKGVFISEDKIVTLKEI